ncbi:MAG: hypothetical protein M1825_002470 [Sarcosagium campestre]|nr:MAG: hypothetical protein M1825_002470 [Sarcosagium campestre]
MPYNSAAILPPDDEPTGQASLPLARVKRIIHTDEDVMNCSNNAAFLITIATEMFVRYLVQQTHQVTRYRQQPSKSVKYKDLAKTVLRVEILEFLSDVIPQTVTFKDYKEKKSREVARAEAMEKHQTTLDGKTANENEHNGRATHSADGDDVDDEVEDGVDARKDESVQARVAALDVEIRGPRSDPSYSSSNGAQNGVGGHGDDVMME